MTPGSETATVKAVHLVPCVQEVNQQACDGKHLDGWVSTRAVPLWSEASCWGRLAPLLEASGWAATL